MQFSNHATNQDLVSDTRWIISGSSTGATDYVINDITRNINSHYDDVVSLILQSDSRWEWDDNNKNDLPVGTTDLVANQEDYGISAASFLKILKVEMKDSNGEWVTLTPRSLDNKRSVSLTETQQTAGTPLEYDKLGNSIFLYPKPNYASTGGLKVWYQRNVTHFTTSDTTAVPGFAENFHRLLSYGAAKDYCITYEMAGKLATIQSEIDKLEAGLVAFYSSRERDDKTSLELEKEDYSDGDASGDYFAGVSFH